MRVGTIGSIHRYPVKSMAGETLSEVVLGEKGLPGDRAWAVRDEVAGGIRSARKIAALLECAARYPEPPKAAGSSPAEVTLPDGSRLLTTDAEVSERVSRAVGREVTVWPLVDPAQQDHYRRAAPDDPDFEQEMRNIFGREVGEPLPDLSQFTPEQLMFETPPGTYFDLSSLLLLTDQSLRSLGAAAPDSVIDVRRFRPNLLIETEGADEPYPEFGWRGGRLRVGEAEIAVKIPCVRCLMTTHGFAEVPRDPGVMRALVRETRGFLGAYAEVARPGVVRVGDAVELDRDL